MRRVRLAFLLTAGALAVLFGLLAWRVLDISRKEQRQRHHTVASRFFDEMERELTLFLRREEDRPFVHYRYLYVPVEGQPFSVDQASAVRFERSPLADGPSEPFVIGYFQIEPDGRLSSPHWPRNEKLAAEQTGWVPTPASASRRHQIQELVQPLRRGSGLSPQQLDVEPSLIDPDGAPGSTIAVHSPTAGAGNTTDDVTQAPVNTSATLLEELNRGAQSRSLRQSKLAKSQIENIYDFARESEINALQQAPLPEAIELEALEADIKSTLKALAGLEVDVQLEPLVGRPLTNTKLALYRTVWVREQAFRQGLLIDTSRLIEWLAQRVVDSSDLDNQSTVLAGAMEPPADRYSYRHRFAEPFGQVLATLSLEPLPQPPATIYLHALLILLSLVLTLGLAALYRMVTTTVSFAERRNHFVNSVTHELRTPLAAIRMYSEMLRDDIVPDPGKRQGYYERLATESERLSRLVNNVLELSRLERDERPMKLELGNVARLVDEVVSLLEPTAKKKGFSMTTEGTTSPVVALFDHDALQQVLFNLVDNAIKYAADANKKEIVVSVAVDVARVVIRVRDFGPGVPRQEQRRIFDPFYRVANESLKSVQGTGIGLALVRGLVKRMGGEVSVEGAEGGGFEIAVALPTERDAAAV